jgi:hypothetical protein
MLQSGNWNLSLVVAGLSKHFNTMSFNMRALFSALFIFPAIKKGF